MKIKNLIQNFTIYLLLDFDVLRGDVHHLQVKLWIDFGL
jgi:hypothetical protein